MISDYQVCYGLLDYILNLHSTCSYSDITQCVDVLVSKSSEILQVCKHRASAGSAGETIPVVYGVSISAGSYLPIENLSYI